MTTCTGTVMEVDSPADQREDVLSDGMGFLDDPDHDERMAFDENGDEIDDDFMTGEEEDPDVRYGEGETAEEEICASEVAPSSALIFDAMKEIVEKLNFMK